MWNPPLAGKNLKFVSSECIMQEIETTGGLIRNVFS